jgi:hypothetical protein
MIRFINCIRKQSHISSEQFREYWNDPKFDAIIDSSISKSPARFLLKPKSEWSVRCAHD